jgi:hypothetical protein
MRGHGVEPVIKSRVYKTPIDQPALPRIRRNIPKLPPKILPVSNPMLVESNLPDFVMKLRPHLMRKPAFDALCAPLNGLVLRRSEQDVDTFRHHNEPMQSVSLLISIVKKRLDQQLGICHYGEQSASLEGRGRERIGFHFGSEEHTSGDKSPSVTAAIVPGINPRPTD